MIPNRSANQKDLAKTNPRTFKKLVSDESEISIQ